VKRCWYGSQIEFRNLRKQSVEDLEPEGKVSQYTNGVKTERIALKRKPEILIQNA
ncbi:hypothetical protein J6590_006137, partial [Homalodisca vitripennis]